MLGVDKHPYPSVCDSHRQRAFAKCKCLSEIKIPSSVGSFGEFAFERCDSLRNLFIDEGVHPLATVRLEVADL